WLFPEKGLPGRNLRGVQWGMVAPRVGIAYQLKPNTIIRTGFGVFYAMAPYGANHYGTSPFGASTPWLNSLDGITPNHRLSNPFPSGVLQPEGSAGGLLSANGLGIGGPVTAEMTTPYNMQWNFTIAQQFGGQLGVEVAYAGNKGVHLPFRTGWYMDQLPYSVHRPDAGLLDLVPNPYFGLIPVGAMSTQNVQRGHLLTPYPHYPSVNFAAPGWGNSNYHSFQAKIEKRFSSGNSVVLAYTFSKLLSDGADNAWDAAGVTDFNCRSCAKSVSPYDQRHRLVTSFTYDLPFGKGKQYGSGWNSFLNAAFGQWQINGIGTINSGLNLQFGVPQNTSFSFGGGQRPDVVAGQEAALDNPTIARWFNTDAFRLPAQYTFGTIGRMHPNLRSDRIENLDFSVFKNFRIKERVTLQFRAEWFNLTNSPIFASPNTTVGSTAFGIVTGQDNLPRQTQLALKFLF
ncbi:MAG: carboxypeptidase regulatory-like domain-containing protein, partial [Bryobacteraceae bacterium]|nr:carboxypeptidase regulatory-like domain-containing protein [Bryobacteraceae bacterium]